MPTEIQYGVEAGGREWALSRGGKHSNNTMKRKRRRRAKEKVEEPRPPTGDPFKWLVSSFHPSSLPSVSLSLLPSSFLLIFPCISLLFFIDALLTEVVLGLGCAARLTLLLGRSRGSNQTQCACICAIVCKVGAGVCFLRNHPVSRSVIISHSAFLYFTWETV